MKKAGNVLVVILLLVSTGGLSITRHLCGNSVMSVSFFSTPDPCCGGDCDKCHNESIFNKVTDEFASSPDARVNVTLNQIPGSLFKALTGSIPAIPIAVKIIYRKFLFLKTGDIPVTSGNFRC